MMRCRKCGAELLDTDTFCVNCGQKVERIAHCPYCGEELRDGEKFCHKCGAMIYAKPEDEEIPLVQQKTVDIPFDQIEQGILLQAEQAIVKRPEPERERKAPEDYVEYYDDDDEDEEEDESGSKMKIVTILLGIVIAAAAAVTGFVLFQKYSPPRYDRPETEQEENGEEQETRQDASESGGEVQGRLQVLSNVNVRTKPDKEDSEVLKVARQGETYEYYELVNDAWYHIKLDDGSDGYVYKDYVEEL